MPAEADAPPDLVTALDRQPRGLGALGALFQNGDRGQIGIEQIEVRKFSRNGRGIGETGKPIFRRCTRHRDRARGELGYVGIDVVRRHQRLAVSDEHAQPHASPSERSDSSLRRRAPRRPAKPSARPTRRPHPRRRDGRPRPVVRQDRSAGSDRGARTSEKNCASRRAWSGLVPSSSRDYSNVSSSMTCVQRPDTAD